MLRLALCSLLLLSGCAWHHTEPEHAVPTSLNQYVLEDHVRTCREKAKDFYSDDTREAQRRYFENCLERAGHTPAEYRHIWY